MGHACPSKILLVEDNPGDARLFREMLCGGDFQFCLIEHVESLEDALDRLESDTFEVVALDLSLPDATDIDGLTKIHALVPSLAVVVVSRLADEDLALKAVRAGAQDYLLKGRIDGFTLTRDPFLESGLRAPAPTRSGSPAPRVRRARPLVLQGIVDFDGQRAARISGQTVHRGEFVRGWKLEEVGERNVVLSRDGERRTLRL